MFKKLLETTNPIIINLDEIGISSAKNLLVSFFMKKIDDMEINDFLVLPIRVYYIIDPIYKKENNGYFLEIVDKNDFIVICTKNVKKN